MITEGYVRTIFKGLENGDGASFFEHVADDVDWTVMGADGADCARPPARRDLAGGAQFHRASRYLRLCVRRLKLRPASKGRGLEFGL